MSKKKKHNLQKLIAKKQYLQQASQGAIVSFEEASDISPYQKPATAIVPATTIQPKATIDRALRKTAFSIVIIAALLVAAVVFDKRSPYLNQFGDWIYATLRLQS